MSYEDYENKERKKNKWLKILRVVNFILFLGLLKIGWDYLSLFWHGELNTKNTVVFSLLFLGYILFLWAQRKFSSNNVFTCGLLSLLLTIFILWLLILAPKDWVQNKSYAQATKMARPLLVQTTQVDIKVSDEKFASGDAGEITIGIENLQNAPIDLKNITIRLPDKFLRGFVVDYPEFPYCNVSELQGFFTTIICEDIVIPSMESIQIVFPIIANELGNYEGNITFEASIGSAGRIFELLTVSEIYRMRVSK